jgi:hypothetical protein
MRRFMNVAAGAGIVLLVTACGAAGGGPGPATLTRYQQALEFSQCMRAHGVPDYPDPSSDGGFAIAVDPSAPALQSAENACRNLMPKKPTTPAQQEQMLSEALRFAECMRTHGVPDYPDPGPHQSGVNVDKRSPAFQAAQHACERLLPVPGGSS